MGKKKRILKNAQSSYVYDGMPVSSKLGQVLNSKRNDKKREELYEKKHSLKVTALYYVQSDNSTLLDKFEVAEKCFGKDKKKLENVDHAVYFHTKDQYTNHTLCEKIPCRQFDYDVETDKLHITHHHFTDRGGKNLYISVSRSPNEELFDSADGEIINVSSSVVMYAMVNSDITSASFGSGFNSYSVMLYRFDLQNHNTHVNHYGQTYPPYEKIFGDKLSSGDQKIFDTYQKYFERKVPTPHFHFCSNTMTSLYKNTAGANAIGLDKLIEYVTDLQKGENEILDYEAFNMPFLAIKNDPTLYKVRKDEERKYQEVLGTSLAYYNLVKDNLDENGNFKAKTGLDAVLFDLNVIKLLSEDYAYDKTQLAMDIAMRLGNETGKFYERTKKDSEKKETYKEPYEEIKPYMIQNQKGATEYERTL